MTQRDVHRVTREALARYCDLKTQVCAEAGGPADCITLLEVHSPSGNSLVVGIPTMDQLAAGVATARAVVGSVSHVVLVAEVLAREVERDDLNLLTRGALAQAQQAGDMAVREMIAVIAFDGRGEPEATQWVECHYDDAGQPWFDEPGMQDASMIGGYVLETMKVALQ